MYDQFKELADVDITNGPMEVGPTTHYVMGGIRVDAETGRDDRPGLFAAGEFAGGMHGANRLGGNSLSDLLVFGARTGPAAAADAAAGAASLRRPGPGPGRRGATLEAPLARTGGEDPYALQRDLQDDHAARTSGSSGSRRTSARRSTELGEPARALERDRRVTGGRAYNPGWNLVFELRNMLIVSEAIARSARAARPRAAARTAGSTSRRPTTEAGATRNIVVRGDGRLDDRVDRAAARRCPTSCAACSASARTTERTDARRAS